MADLTPGSDEWTRRVTASKVAAILGVSPFESQRSMWHLMRGDIEKPPAKEEQRRGHYLEPAVLAWWRDQHDIREASVAYGDEWHEMWTPQPTYTLGEWAAATPDALAFPDGEPALVEAKSENDMDEYGDPCTDVLPAYYLVQTYWQMHVAGVRRCYVPVIGPYLRFTEYVVDYDEAIGRELEQRCRAFYDSLTADVPPPLDSSTATYNAVRRIHPDIEHGQVVQLDADQAREYVAACLEFKAAEKRERLAKSRMNESMGRAQYANCGTVRIARRQPAKGAVALYRVAKSTTDLPEGTAA